MSGPELCIVGMLVAFALGYLLCYFVNGAGR